MNEYPLSVIINSKGSYLAITSKKILIFFSYFILGITFVSGHFIK